MGLFGYIIFALIFQILALGMYTGDLDWVLVYYGCAPKYIKEKIDGNKVLNIASISFEVVSCLNIIGLLLELVYGEFRKDFLIVIPCTLIILSMLAVTFYICHPKTVEKYIGKMKQVTHRDVNTPEEVVNKFMKALVNFDFDTMDDYSDIKVVDILGKQNFDDMNVLANSEIFNQNIYSFRNLAKSITYNIVKQSDDTQPAGIILKVKYKNARFLYDSVISDLEADLGIYREGLCNTEDMEEKLGRLSEKLDEKAKRISISDNVLKLEFGCSKKFGALKIDKIIDTETNYGLKSMKNLIQSNVIIK